MCIPSSSTIKTSVEDVSSLTAASLDEITKMSDSFSSLTSSSRIGIVVHSIVPELEFSLKIRKPSTV